MIPNLTLTPSHTALAANQASTLDVLVRLTPLAAAIAADRPSLNLAVVIDRSTSMGGHPLEQAKLAAIDLVRRLDARDRVAVVAYGDTASVLIESVPVAEARERIVAAIAAIRVQGCTALHSGWLHGAQAIAPFVSAYGVSRVLLLSDGQANVGIQDVGQIASEASRLAESGISTSTYGLGLNFNETLMTALAQRGLGQAFYAESAEALAPYFESEFAMLAATVGRQVRVQFKATLNGLPLPVSALSGEAASEAGWSMPALVSGAESWVVMRVEVPASASKNDIVLEATARWQDLDNKQHSASLQSTVPVKKNAKLSTDEAIVERVKELDAARLQREAIDLARRGDWAGTQTILRGLQAGAVNNAYVAGVAANLSSLADSQDFGRFSKEALYASHTMSARSVDVNEDVSKMANDRFGLRKSKQGAAAPVAKE